MWRRVRAAALTMALSQQRRAVNKGYREQPPVPSQLKEALSSFGVDMHKDDEKAPFVPEERRHTLLRQMAASKSSNMRSYRKQDRLRNALDAAAGHPATHASWRDVYLFLRTLELACELAPRADDVWPKGQKLWVELAVCEERRVPVLQRLPNGLLVLPVFTLEEYMDHYYERANVFAACWFPSPRGGSQWDEFCKQPFPVCATGQLQHMAALATVALRAPQLQVGLLLNPGQQSSKFVTFPEATLLARLHRAYQQRQQQQQPQPSPQAKQQEPSPQATLTAATAKDDEVLQCDPVAVLDSNLVVAFDTRKMPITRVEPAELLALYKSCLAEAEATAAAATSRRALVVVPPMARLELHLLLHPYEAITHVFVRTLPTSRWRRTLLGASTHFTQIDVVCDADTSTAAASRLSRDFVAHLQRWSYLSEFKTDIHIELTSTPPLSPAPPSPAAATAGEAAGGDSAEVSAAAAAAAAAAAEAMAQAPLCVYTAADGAMLRGMSVHKRTTIADSIGYSEPLLDEHGGKPFEPYSQYYH